MTAFFRRVVERLARCLGRRGVVPAPMPCDEAGARLGYESAHPHLQGMGERSGRG